MERVVHVHDDMWEREKDEGAPIVILVLAVRVRHAHCLSDLDKHCFLHANMVSGQPGCFMRLLSQDTGLPQIDAHAKCEFAGACGAHVAQTLGGEPWLEEGNRVHVSALCATNEGAGPKMAEGLLI